MRFGYFQVKYAAIERMTEFEALGKVSTSEHTRNDVEVLFVPFTTKANELAESIFYFLSSLIILN